MSLNEALSPAADTLPGAGLITDLFARFRNAQRLRRARAELHRLSDHDLADLGIARSEIDRVVATGRRATR